MDEEKLLRVWIIALSVSGLIASSIMSVQTETETIGFIGIVIFSGFIGHWGNK